MTLAADDPIDVQAFVPNEGAHGFWYYLFHPSAGEGPGYSYYLTHPWEMDAGLETGFYVSGGIGIVAGGIAAAPWLQSALAYQVCRIPWGYFSRVEVAGWGVGGLVFVETGTLVTVTGTHVIGLQAVVGAAVLHMSNPDDFEVLFETFEEAIGERYPGGTTNIERFKTTNDGAIRQGFLEQWLGLRSDGEWWSAFYNNVIKKFSGGHKSSRNWW